MVIINISKELRARAKHSVIMPNNPLTVHENDTNSFSQTFVKNVIKRRLVTKMLN